MKVLIVTFGSVLEPRGGLAVRARTDIDILTSMGHELTILSHFEPREREVEKIPRASLMVLRRQLHLGWSWELRSLCRQLVPQADFTVVMSAMLLPAVLGIRARSPIVWDTNECESLHYGRLPTTPKNILKMSVWRWLEAWASKRSDVVLAIGDTEAMWWRRLFPAVDAKMMVVDHRPFVLNFNGALVSQAWHPPENKKILLFVGNLVGKHNATAAQWLVEVLAPNLESDALLVLAGPGTEHLHVPRNLMSHVQCLGEVADLDRLISRADLCLAPLAAGAGVKTKVLHYLALGKPVLATPAAAEGVEDAPGVTVVSLTGFPKAVAASLAQDHESQTSREARLSWFEERCGDDVLAGQWSDVIDRLGIQQVRSI